MINQSGGGDTSAVRGHNKHPKATVSKRTKQNQQTKAVLQEVLVEDVVGGGDSDESVDTSPGSPPTETTTETGKRKRTSDVWNEFEQILDNGVVVQGKCRHCNKKLGAKTKNGTSNMIKHLKRCAKFRQTQKAIDQMYLQASEKGDGSIAAFNFRFNQEVTRDHIARMIILHELPFAFVEYIGFRRVLNSLQPSLKLVKRNTTKSDCMKVFVKDKKDVYETFSKLQSRISLTTDMWTCTTQNRGYMVLTGHYIDEEWKVQKRILSFCTIEGQHTGANIAEMIMKKLYEWNIDRKLASITLDNASTNDGVVRELLLKLRKEKALLSNGVLFQVRCSAHVIAIIVDHGMLLIKEEIHKVRNSVKFIRSSPQRQAKFEEVCLQVNAPKKKLIQDVDTRWNSTFLMLETALEFKEAFDRYAKMDPDFRNVVPNDEDWNNANSLAVCLKVFYEVTVLFSGTKYVTINRYFDVACSLHIQIYEWLNSSDKLISKMAWNMKDRFDKYWKLTSKTFAIASILDPRFKLQSMAYYFPLIYPSNKEEHESEIKDTLKSLYNEYVECYASSAHVYSGNNPTNEGHIKKTVSCSVGGGTSTASASSFTAKLKGFTTFLEESSQNTVVLTDLEQYLKDDAHPIKTGSGVINLNDTSFDVLGWWKYYGPKYPIVALMARDILGIPASSVASESVFSTSGRVIGKYRSSMLPETIEALICGQDYIRSLLEKEGMGIDDPALGTVFGADDENEAVAASTTDGNVDC